MLVKETQESRSIGFTMFKMIADMKQQLTYLDITITPSTCCKSNKEQVANFDRLNETLGIRFGNVEIEKLARELTTEITQFETQSPVTFKFDWDDRTVGT
jgi:precorrin-4 methylase